jgi:hypothetical protein
MLGAVLLLPAMVAVAIPAIIVSRSGADIDVLPALFGGALIALGLALVVWTLKLFVTVGRGTLAPWMRPRDSSSAGLTATCAIR